MTQEEFDALDDTPPGGLAIAPAKTGGVLATLRNQGPVRLGAIGLMVLAAGAFGAARFLGDAPVEVSAVEPVSAPVALPMMPAAPKKGIALPTPVVRPIENREQVAFVPAEFEAPKFFGPQVASTECTVTTSIMPLAGAIIALDIRAPCDAGTRADIFQGDLQITISLDDDGRAQINVPALSAEPTVAVAVEGRTPVSALAQVSDIDGYSRTVLHWQGDMALELHAFETRGASYGGPGHVSPANPAGIARVLSRSGGYITTLGDISLDDAHIAQVYTVPADKSVEISIEAPVTASNCTHEVTAGTIRIAPGVDTLAQDVTLTMPDCDATGDYVMLDQLTLGASQVALAAN